MLPPLSVATAKDCVLVVIDIQDRLAAVMERRRDVDVAAGLLIRTAVITGVPVVVTRQYPKGLGDVGGDIQAVLTEARADGATVATVDKVTFDCFAEPEFVDAVCATGRRQLVLAGMETHICVTQTALSGLREGFDVHVASDATCSRASGAHASALRRLSAAGAVITHSESVAYELVGRAGTAEFKRLLAAVKSAGDAC